MDGDSTTKKFVHLVRHGKYLGSPVGEVLSPIGIRQAELTGGHLQQIVSHGNPRRKLASIMHSSTPRAAHTAGIISKYFPSACVEPSELLCGKDPFSPSSDAERWKSAFEQIFTDPESSEDDRYATYIIVSHAQVIKYFTFRVLQIGNEYASSERVCLANCSITTFEIRSDSNVILHCLGDCGHFLPYLTTVV